VQQDVRTRSALLELRRAMNKMVGTMTPAAHCKQAADDGDSFIWGSEHELHGVVLSCLTLIAITTGFISTAPPPPPRRLTTGCESTDGADLAEAASACCPVQRLPPVETPTHEPRIRALVPATLLERVRAYIVGGGCVECACLWLVLCVSGAFRFVPCRGGNCGHVMAQHPRVELSRLARWLPATFHQASEADAAAVGP